MRFSVQLRDNQLVDGPGGGPVGTAGSPLAFPRSNANLEWNYLQDYGVYQAPKLLPASTAITFALKRVGQFEGVAVIAIDPDEVVRPTIGTGTTFLINHGGGYEAGDTDIALDGDSGTILAGDVLTIGNYPYAVAVGRTGAGSISLASGLVEPVPDNAPVLITGSTRYYTATMYGDTDEAETALLTPDGNPGNDIDSVNLAGELTWKFPDAPMGAKPQLTQRIYARLDNVYTQDGDAAPSRGSITTPTFFRTITGYTGGTSDKLDSVPTIGKTVPSLVAIVVSGVAHLYELVSATTAESSPSIIRPDDYATTTNEKVWKLVDGGNGDMLKSTYDPQNAGKISGASAGGGTGGTLTMDGAINNAGSIDTSSNLQGAGGSISTRSGVGGTSPGGSIDTSGGSSGAGGSISTAGGGLSGGSVDTHDGGGSINTRGTGSIELGAAGTRTTVSGTATGNRAIALPDAAGTLALTSGVTLAAILAAAGITPFTGTVANPTSVTWDRGICTAAS